QKFHDFEWLIKDGNSQDQTHSLLKEWTDEITWHDTSPDNGIYHAMNKSLAQAKGDYLLFLNAGDQFATEETLIQCANILKRSDIDFAYGDAYETSPNGTKLLKSARHHRWAWYGMFTHHQAMFYRHSIIQNLHYNL